MTDKNYEPYGEEWKKEIRKNRKEGIVNMLASALKMQRIATMALDTISSGFGDSKQEIENYAKGKLIEIENTNHT